MTTIDVMKKFEYTMLEVPTKGFWARKIDYEALTSTLNELGKKGWEAVSATNSTAYQSGTSTVIIILKREIY